MSKIVFLVVLVLGLSSGCAMEHGRPVPSEHGGGQACLTCHVGDHGGTLRVPSYPDAGINDSWGPDR